MVRKSFGNDGNDVYRISVGGHIYRREKRGEWFYNGKNGKDKKIIKKRKIIYYKNGNGLHSYIGGISLFPNLRLPVIIESRLENIIKKLGLIKGDNLEVSTN